MSSLEATCPECQQSCGAGQSACAHCGASLLVDVVLESPVTDARARFTAAKALAAIHPAGMGFSELQRTLTAPLPRPITAVTRALAQRCVEALSKEGLRAQAVPHALPVPAARIAARPEAPKRKVTAGGLLGAALFLLLAGAVNQLAHRTRAAAPTPVNAAGPDPSLLESAIASTVSVRCESSVASGFFVSPSLVLTNAHAVCPAGRPMELVLRGGRKLLGITRKKDERLDLAVVEAMGGEGKPLPLGDAAKLRPGEAVASIGSPKGLEFTVSRGSVSYVGRPRLGVGYVQVDININPGNSGGPLVDSQGRVVGVVSMMVKDSNGLGLALPINYAVEGAGALLDREKRESSPEWTALLAQLAKADEDEVEEVRRSLERPGLVGALLRPNRSLVAVLIQRSEHKPPEGTRSFSIQQDDGTTCGPLSGLGVTWSAIDDKMRAWISDKRLSGWLEEHRLDGDLWVGLEELAVGCEQPVVPTRSVLRLEGSNSELHEAIVLQATDDLLIVRTAAVRVPASKEEADLQAELARRQAVQAEAARVLDACAEHAKNLGSNSTCYAPYQRYQKAKSDADSVKWDLERMQREKH